MLILDHFSNISKLLFPEKLSDPLYESGVAGDITCLENPQQIYSFCFSPNQFKNSLMPERQTVLSVESHLTE